MVQEANWEASAADAIVKVPELLHWAGGLDQPTVDPDSQVLWLTVGGTLDVPKAAPARARAGRRY